MTAGLKDEKTSIIVKAGQFKTITEAINKVLEEAPQSPNEVTVQYTKSYNRQNQSKWQASGIYQNSRHNRGNSNSYRGGRNNYQNQNNRYYSNNRDNRYNHDNRNENFNHRRGSGNNQSRGSRGWSDHQSQRNVYVSENERRPSEIPQAEAQQHNGETTYPNRD